MLSAYHVVDNHLYTIRKAFEDEERTKNVVSANPTAAYTGHTSIALPRAWDNEGLKLPDTTPASNSVYGGNTFTEAGLPSTATDRNLEQPQS